MSITKNGKGLYYTDENYTSIDLINKFDISLFKCYRDQLRDSNSYSIFYGVTELNDRFKRVEHIYKNGCYKSRSFAYSVGAQSDYVSVSYFNRSKQCVGKVGIMFMLNVMHLE